MNPSPPNRPTPILRWNAMPIDTPRAAQRNESFWQISVPPSCFRSIARILPGYGAANATCCLPLPWLVKTVMNRLSPVMRRLPAPSSAPITPERCCCDPSPKTVSIWMPGRHVHHRAGFGHGALAGIELDFDELHLAAEDAEVDLVRARARRDRRRRGRRRAASGRREEGGEHRHVLERRPVRHARREDERVAVNGAVPQVGDDVFLRHRSDLVAADGHVPLLLCHRLLSDGGANARASPASTCLTRLPAHCFGSGVDLRARRRLELLHRRRVQPSRFASCAR